MLYTPDDRCLDFFLFRSEKWSPVRRSNQGMLSLTEPKTPASRLTKQSHFKHGQVCNLGPKQCSPGNFLLNPDTSPFLVQIKCGKYNLGSWNGLKFDVLSMCGNPDYESYLSYQANQAHCLWLREWLVMVNWCGEWHSWCLVMLD